MFVVVFHDTLHEKYYDIHPEEFRSLVFYAVSPTCVVPDFVTERGATVMWEHELPVYDPSWQARGFCEFSALWHLLANGVTEDITVFQWDMALPKGCINDMKDSFQTIGRYKAPFLITYDALNRAQIPQDVMAMVKKSVTQFGSIGPHKMYPMCCCFTLDHTRLRVLVDWCVDMMNTLEPMLMPWDYPQEWKRRGIVAEHALALAAGAMIDDWVRVNPQPGHLTSFADYMTDVLC